VALQELMTNEMLGDPLKHVGDRTEGGRHLEKPSGIWLRAILGKKIVLQQLLQSNSLCMSCQYLNSVTKLSGGIL